MMTGLALLATLVLGSASVQEGQPAVPASCQQPMDRIDFRACANDASVGSAARSWALINLGTRAFLTGDMAAAVSFYDEARPTDGNQIYSDPLFHAFRGASYDHVGRTEEGLSDARTSWEILSGARVVDPNYPPPTNDEYRSLVLMVILPILKAANDPAFEPGFAAYKSIPANDTDALMKRASLLEKVGDFAGALAASEQVLKQLPDDPAVQNNHCYTLVRAGRASEGLPYCEKAVASLPEIAPIRHSYAAALAQLGRCDEAERQMAEARRLDPAGTLYRQALTCGAAAN